MKKMILSVRLTLLTLAFVVGPVHAQKLSIPGVSGPAINVLDGKVIVTVKLLNLELQAGGEMLIPKTKHSSFQMSPNIVDGGTLLQLSLDPSDIKGVKVANDPNTLPDGRPLPGIPGGALASLRVDTDLFHTSYYFGKTLFGIYFPAKINTQGFGASYAFNVKGKVAGSISLVASDATGRSSGFLFFLKKIVLDESLQAKIEESIRNPGVLY